jgi:hypothetical protein
MSLSADGAQHALTSMLIVGLGIEIFAEFKSGNVPPRPSRFVGVCLVYGICAMLVTLSASFATVLGGGLLLALIVKMPKIMANGAANPGQNMSVYSNGTLGNQNPGVLGA